MGAISHRRLQCRAAARVSALVRARRKAESLVAEGALGRRDQVRGGLRVIHEGVGVEQQSLEVDLRQHQAAPEQREQLGAPQRQPEPNQSPIDNLITGTKAKKELRPEGGFGLPGFQVGIKTEPDLKSEFGIKSEFEIKVEFGAETKPGIGAGPEIKAEADIKAELKVKIEPRIKAEPGIKTETEVKQGLDTKMEEAEKKEEYLKMEDDLKTERFWIGDVQMEWVVAIKEELVKLEDAPWSHVPYYCYYL